MKHGQYLGVHIMLSSSKSRSDIYKTPFTLRRHACLHASCMSPQCEQRHWITWSRMIFQKCRSTCRLHAGRMSIDMRPASCMSIYINVDRHLSPRTNLHVLGRMHPACRLHAAEIVPMLSNGAVHTTAACRSTFLFLEQCPPFPPITVDQYYNVSCAQLL